MRIYSKKIKYKTFCSMVFFLATNMVYNISLAQINPHRVIFQGGNKFYIEPKTNITWADFHEFLTSKINYPRQIRSQGLKGNIKISFVVDKQGRISNIEVLESFNKECEKAVLDAIKSKEASKWKHIGKPQKVTKEITIEFKLGPKFKKE